MGGTYSAPGESWDAVRRGCRYPNCGILLIVALFITLAAGSHDPPSSRFRARVPLFFSTVQLAV